jgi:hypothetical protein
MDSLIALSVTSTFIAGLASLAGFLEVARRASRLDVLRGLSRAS